MEDALGFLWRWGVLKGLVGSGAVTWVLSVPERLWLACACIPVRPKRTTALFVIYDTTAPIFLSSEKWFFLKTHGHWDDELESTKLVLCDLCSPTLRNDICRPFAKLHTGTQEKLSASPGTFCYSLLLNISLFSNFPCSPNIHIHITSEGMFFYLRYIGYAVYFTIRLSTMTTGFKIVWCFERTDSLFRILKNLPLFVFYLKHLELISVKIISELACNRNENHHAAGEKKPEQFKTRNKAHQVKRWDLQYP